MKETLKGFFVLVLFPVIAVLSIVLPVILYPLARTIQGWIGWRKFWYGR